MKKQLQIFLSLKRGRLLLLAMMMLISQGVVFSQANINVTTAADGGAGSLRQAIVDAVDGEVIGFDAAITTITLDSTLNLGDKTLTIEGGGIVVLQRDQMALDSFRIVTIMGDSGKVVTMKNLTIQYGFSKGEGGGMYVDYKTPGGGKAILENIVFDNNFATAVGGGLHIRGFEGDPCLITNCVFSNNKANDGASEGDAGGMYAEYTITTACDFIENVANDNGGAVDSRNGSEIYNSRFIGNVANGSGGAIRNSSTPGILKNCFFEGNSSNEQGGAIFAARGEISNSSFINNVALGNGGAMYLNNDAVSLSNCVIRNNQSMSSGGGIFSDDGAYLSNCIIEQNQSAENGGGIYIKDNTAELVSSIISNNKADSIGGGIYAEKGKVINCNIVKNFAENGGGLSGNGEWFIANSIFYDNDATGVDKDIQFIANLFAASAANCALSLEPAGWTASNITVLTASPFIGGSEADSLMLASGSALIDAGDITGVENLIPDTDLIGVKRIINGTIDLGAYERYISFVVTTDADAGAGSLRQAIADAVDGESLITFADGITTIKVDQPLELGDSTVIIDGGGDVILDGAFNGDPALDITRVVTIIGDSARTVTIKNLTIQNGFAQGANGGGLSADHSAQGKTILESIIFKNNTAVNGGGLSILGYNADTVSMVTNCEFINNLATDGANEGDGGGCYAEHTILSGCTFTDNQANDDAAALYANNEVKIDNSTFSGNIAVGAGGAIRTGNETIVISECTFDSNSTGPQGGGAIFLARGNVLNSEFVNNTSGSSGGAIYANNNECIIENSMFSGNSATTVGGAVYFDDGGMLSNSIVKGNTAVTNGGGLYLKGANAPPTIVGCVVANNTADAQGGGVYVLKANLVNNIITMNYAGVNGGALTGNGAWFLANTVVWDNDAAGTDKNIEVVANSATTAAANCAIDATAYNATWIAINITALDSSPFIGGIGADSLYFPSTSALIDAGTTEYGIADLLPDMDLDGANRIQGTIDLGVYETSIVRVIGVSLNESVLELIVGGTGNLIATVDPDFATDKSVNWSSSDETVATVVDGVVTGVASGSATITVTTTNGGLTATCEVLVAIPVTGVTLDQSAVTLDIAGTVTLVATVAPANATNQTIGWVSGNEDVATVNGGLVTAISSGTATISVVTMDGSFIAICEVTVNVAIIAVTGVSLDQSTLALEPGGTATLVATVAPQNATDKSVSWSSSDNAVATVANGVVSAVADGTCTITVTTTDGGKTATCAVTVQTVGINQFESGFKVYPNPVQSNLFIEGENIHSVTIYSVTGAPVMTVKEGLSKGINVSALKSGMYFLKVTADSGTAVIRIAKK